MTLLETLTLLAGGAGSGCNPAVAEPRCGRPSGNAETRHGVKTALINVSDKDTRKVANQAAEFLGRQRIDRRLLDSHLVHEFVKRESKNPENVALFSPQNKNMYIYKRGNALDIVHELGHAIDYKWLKTTAQERESKVINPDVVRSLMKSIESEYHQKVKQTIGDKDPKKMWTKVTSRNIPSVYSIYNKEEWLAESFAEYFKNNDRLKRVAPKTYNALKQILEGKIFRK